MWIKIKRVIRAGFFSFWRNGFVSLSSILVMVVTLFVIGSVIFSGVILRFTLEELGENPLGAKLNIRAKDPGQYENIAKFLQNQSALSVGNTSIIDKVNYYQNKEAIDRLTSIINSSNRLGFVLTIFLVVISVLITFNTLRLVIYMSRDEISVMRLVGASRNYIRGPFFVAGAIYGFISAVITLIIFYPVTLLLGGTTEQFFIGLNIFQYYTANFGQIFAIITLSGVAIGSISSYLATRKYLKV